MTMACSAARRWRPRGAHAGLLLLAGLAGVDARAEESSGRLLGEDLMVRALAPGVWLHVSFKPDKKTSANGLLVTTGEMSLLVDTAWTTGQTRRLLDWAADTLGQPVEHLIVTHADDDRLGGLEAALERPKIVTHGHAYTARFIERTGHPALHWTFEFEERLTLGGEAVDLLYPGPGHAPDNIVVYLPRRQVLFASCLIRPASDEDLGTLEHANLRNWPLAVRRVIERYREVRILVPGHGQPGGVELLSHTMELLERALEGGKLPAQPEDRRRRLTPR
jgi:metallo-beta-lactamase class B